MREGGIDLVIVGADRIAANGDTANKIGTYLKALAAADNQIPFLCCGTDIDVRLDGKERRRYYRLKPTPVDEIRWVRRC